MTTEQINKIVEKWAFKAAEEAENQGGFDVPNQFVPFITQAITEALTPAWTKDLPKEAGIYWLRVNREAPKLMTVYRESESGGYLCSDLEAYYNEVDFVDRTNGKWSRITPPALPKKSEKRFPKATL